MYFRKVVMVWQSLRDRFWGRQNWDRRTVSSAYKMKWVCGRCGMYVYRYIYTQTRTYIYIYTYNYRHIYIYDCTATVYELPLLPNNTAVKHFYTNRSGANCWLDVYRWGAGLAVTGRVRDIGQNALQGLPIVCCQLPCAVLGCRVATRSKFCVILRRKLKWRIHIEVREMCWWCSDEHLKHKRGRSERGFMADDRAVMRSDCNVSCLDTSGYVSGKQSTGKWVSLV